MLTCDTTICIIVGAYFLSNSLHSTTENTAPTPYNYNIHTLNPTAHIVLCHHTGSSVFNNNHWGYKGSVYQCINGIQPKASGNFQPALYLVFYITVFGIFRFPTPMSLKQPVWDLCISSSCHTTSSQAAKSKIGGWQA